MNLIWISLQAIDWILELCDVMVESQVEVDKGSNEAEKQQSEHNKLETTAQVCNM